MIDKKERQPFIDVFLAKNQELNLSAIRDEEGVFMKHVCDALEILKVDEGKYIENAKDVIDVGTGGWIPLLPLAAVFSDVHFTGLDSVRKKTIAISDMVETLWLHNVNVVRSRAEDHKKQYDVLTARAMAYVEELMQWCYRLVKKWGYFILYKMWSEEEEIAVDAACEKYKLALESQHMYKLFPEDIQRVIYVMKKL